VAETLRSASAIGPLQEICERWFSSAVLCYLLPVAQQQAMDMRYEWSVYQLEYSRNLLFSNGRVMEEIFQSVIDRTRRVLGRGDGADAVRKTAPAQLPSRPQSTPLRSRGRATHV